MNMAEFGELSCRHLPESQKWGHQDETRCVYQRVTTVTGGT